MVDVSIGKDVVVVEGRRRIIYVVVDAKTHIVAWSEKSTRTIDRWRGQDDMQLYISRVTNSSDHDRALLWNVRVIDPAPNR